MKKNGIFGAILTVLLVFQAQTAFAADYYADFFKELNRNNLQNIEKLLNRRARQMDLTYCLYFTINSETHYKGFNKANCLDVVKLLVKYGVDLNNPYVFMHLLGISLIWVTL